jgi:ABC-type molybdenum transport system ATPase subunit/photorepair protein PhrA
MIELRDVRVEYRGRAVVRDASLSIAAGERVALIGPNGAGKSTLGLLYTSDAADE